MQSFKTKLDANKWALAEFIFRTTIYPFFRSKQRIKLLKRRGLGNTLFRA
jgi:hypothetical protein